MTRRDWVILISASAAGIGVTLWAVYVALTGGAYS